MPTSIESAEAVALQSRTLRTLVFSQMLGGAGLAAGITVGALLAEDLLNSTSYAGLPAALFTAGSAAAALIIGRISQRKGRRVGLGAGYAAGAIGGLGIVLAAMTSNVPLFLVSLLIYGAGTATNLQARYAGADLAPPSGRGRAVSVVLVATTLGAVAGPNLVEATGNFAEAIDIPRLAGPFILAGAAYAMASLVLGIFLRPDPLLVARSIAASGNDPDRSSTGEIEVDAGDRGDMWLAATAMVLTQIIMVAIMTMTPIHMRDHGHSLGATGMVIAVHIAFMYLPSPISGILVDRVGRRPVIFAGGIVLLAAGILAAVAPPESMGLLTVALALLGLGWNFGLIGGTALLTDSLPVATRAKTQGAVDLSVSLAGATGGLASGVIVSAASYATLGLVGGALSLLVLPLLLMTRKGSGRD